MTQEYVGDVDVERSSRLGSFIHPKVVVLQCPSLWKLIEEKDEKHKCIFPAPNARS